MTPGTDDASPPRLRVTGQAEGLGADMTIRGEVALTALPIATLTRLFTQAAEAHLNLELRDLVVGQSRFKAVTITQRRERVDVTLGEGVLDAQSLMRALSRQEEAAAPSSTSRPDLYPNDKTAALVVRLNAPALRRVSLGDNRSLHAVTATLTHGPEGWRTIDLAARIPETLVQRPRTARHTAEQPPQPRTVSVQYRTTAQGPYALSVRTNDLGAVLRVCDLHDGVTGGPGDHRRTGDRSMPRWIAAGDYRDQGL